MSFDCCDDYGVWVVVPSKKGRWVSEESAQDECNRRNFAAGISNVDGELKDILEVADERVFHEVHYKHAECTCSRESVHESLLDCEPN